MDHGRFRTANTKHDNDLQDRLTDSLVNYEVAGSKTRVIQSDDINIVQHFTILESSDSDDSIHPTSALTFF